MNKNRRRAYTFGWWDLGLAIAASIGLGGASCLPMGCASMQKKTVEEQRAFLDTLSKFARDNDMALSISGAYDGDTGFYGKSQFGIKTGAVLQATLIANAADEEPVGSGNAESLAELVSVLKALTEPPPQPNTGVIMQNDDGSIVFKPAIKTITKSPKPKPTPPVVVPPAVEPGTPGQP